MNKKVVLFFFAGWLLAAIVGPRELFAKIRG